jgi:hypothetical protein
LNEDVQTTSVGTSDPHDAVIRNGSDRTPGTTMSASCLKRTASSTIRLARNIAAQSMQRTRLPGSMTPGICMIQIAATMNRHATGNHEQHQQQASHGNDIPAFVFHAPEAIIQFFGTMSIQIGRLLTRADLAATAVHARSRRALRATSPDHPISHRSLHAGWQRPRRNAHSGAAQYPGEAALAANAQR